MFFGKGVCKATKQVVFRSKSYVWPLQADYVFVFGAFFEKG
jgi:hypothetical protein